MRGGRGIFCLFRHAGSGRYRNHSGISSRPDRSRGTQRKSYSDKNKTFFFFSEEARRIHTYTNFNPILPAQGMLAGNFSALVCISYTTSCQATATQIPTSQINPIAAQYVKDIFSKLPLPSVNTLAAQSAGFFPVQNIYNSRQEIVRNDHTVSDRLSNWGTFENDMIPTVEPGGLFTGAVIPGVAVTNTNAPGRSFVIHAVETLRPNFLNDMAFNYSQSAINSTPAVLMNKSLNPDINVPEPFVNTQGVVPELTFTGGSSLLGYAPYNEYNRSFNGYDNFTWIRGPHGRRPAHQCRATVSGIWSYYGNRIGIRLELQFASG